mmetsp:Transcript_6246/g.19984  ORF Transcript_6246/g.19984 Transcript_6246/m.19984 type:complete len:449 (+) Transcript_6246:1202-2548(+)
MLPFGAAEKAAKKAVPFAVDAAGLDAAKKAALASLPDTLVDKLGQGSPDMFFSAALTQTAAKAACILFSDKAEVPPIFRSLSIAFEGQMQFGFAPPAMMAQFNIDKAPALLVLWNENEGKDEDAQAGMKLTGARFMPQVHGKFSYGNIAAFVASVAEQRLQMLGVHAEGAKPAGGEGEGGRRKAAGAGKEVGPPPELSAANFEAECTQRGGLCAVALLDGGPDNGNKEAQLAVLAKLRKRGAGGPLSYSWLDATCHTDFVAAFGLGETDLPTMLVLSPGKARWARSVGAFDAETLGAFANGVAAGRRATESIDAVPALQEVDCATVARGADAVAEDDALGDEIMAEILEEERREREAREAEAAAAAAAAAAGGGQDEGGVAKDEMSELQRMEAELEQCGVEDLLCKARNEKQLRAIEKRRQLEEKLAKIAKKKKKAKAKAKKAAKKGA